MSLRFSRLRFLCVCAVCSVVSTSLQLYGLQPARLLCPRDFPSKNTGVSCHFLLQGIFPTQGSNLCLLHWQVDSLPLLPPGKPISHSLSVQYSSVTQSCPTLCDPMDHSTPGFPVHHQLQKLAQTQVHRTDDALQPSHPLLSPSSPSFKSFPALGSFPMSQFFTSDGQSAGVSASASVLPMNIQD